MEYSILPGALRERCCFEYLYLTDEETEARVPPPFPHLHSQTIANQDLNPVGFSVVGLQKPRASL